MATRAMMMLADGDVLMLNDALVQEFHEIHGQQRSGSLHMQRVDDQAVQFYFEDGNLRLLDFSEPKELLLLRQYRRYHKIGAEIQALVEQLFHTQDVSVNDYLHQQQLVTEDEIGQVTRTLLRMCFVTALVSHMLQLL